MWGGTEGGRRAEGGRAELLLLPPRAGDSGFGVEEADVVSCVAVVLTPLKPFDTGAEEEEEEESWLWENGRWGCEGAAVSTPLPDDEEEEEDDEAAGGVAELGGAREEGRLDRGIERELPRGSLMGLE